MIPGGAGTLVFPGKGAPAPGTRGPKAFVLREGPQGGDCVCRPFPCGPFCLSCLLPSILSSLRHPALVPSVYPPTRPSVHKAIIFPSFRPFSPCSARLFPWLVRGSVPPRPSIQGPCIHPSLFGCSCATVLSWSPSLASFPRLFPESLSGALFQTRLPPAVLQPACHPPALSSDIGNPCTRFFPMDVFIEVFKDILTGLFRNACSGSCAGTPVPPVLHPVALWHCCPIAC